MTHNLIVCVGLNKFYKIYIPYYILFLYYTNPDIDILIITDDSYVENYEESLNYVSKIYGVNKIKTLINPEYLSSFPNNVKPWLVARSLLPTCYYNNYDYVYFGDIDIFISENDIINKHIAKIVNSDLSCDNIIRYSGTKNLFRLSGLHFIDVKKYISRYEQKINNFDWKLYIDWLNNIHGNNKYEIFDEQIWYYILSNDEIEIIRKKVYDCPFHGFHLGIYRKYNYNLPLSQNQINEIKEHAFKDMDWYIKYKKYIENELYPFKNLIIRDEFIHIHDLLKDYKTSLFIEFIKNL